MPLPETRPRKALETTWLRQEPDLLHDRPLTSQKTAIFGSEASKRKLKIPRKVSYFIPIRAEISWPTVGEARFSKPDP